MKLAGLRDALLARNPEKLLKFEISRTKSLGVILPGRNLYVFEISRTKRQDTPDLSRLGAPV